MGKVIDLRGKMFGQLIAIEPTEERKKGSVVWKCICTCGNIKYASVNNLKQGCVTSCGCKKIEKLIERNKPKNIKGQRFGRLVAIEFTDKRDNSSVVWKCKCDCGNITFVNYNNLMKGNTKSCGCLNSKKARENAPKNLEKFREKNYVGKTRLDIIDSNTLNKNNTTGYKGVYLRKKDNKYIAQIEFQGKRHFLGSYETKEEAYRSRKKAEEKLYNEFLKDHR